MKTFWLILGGIYLVSFICMIISYKTAIQVPDDMEI